MKKEEIEQLLVDYINGQISAGDKERLNDLFEKDASLKQEAEEMAEMWNHFDQAEATVSVSESMNRSLYQMLQAEKASLHKDNGRVVSIKRIWLNVAALVLFCFGAFAFGRFGVTPQTVFKYKTVYIKQPANIPSEISKPVVAKPAVGLALQTARKKQDGEGNNVLAQQLRSVYVSERIEAAMKLSAKQNPNAADLKMLQLALSEDPNANVRLAIVNGLRSSIKRPDVQQVLINSLDKQGDVMVQTSIVDMLVAAKSKQAIPQMITLLNNRNTDTMVQNKIKDGVETFLN